MAGARLIDRWCCGIKTFTAPPRILKFALIAFTPTALLGAAFAAAGDAATSLLAIPAPALSQQWAMASLVKFGRWWLADGAMSTLLTPVMVLWATAPLRPPSNRGMLETIGVLTIAAACGAVAFVPWPDSVYGALLPARAPFAFLILLPLLWSGLRGRQRDGATAALIFCGIASIAAAYPAANDHPSM